MQNILKEKLCEKQSEDTKLTVKTALIRLVIKKNTKLRGNNRLNKEQTLNYDY